MAWQDEIRNAFIGGVPFHCPSADQPKCGRIVVKHKYNGVDQASFEDIAADDTDFNITLVVTGPDYMVQRDALLKVLGTPGPVELVHPWRGTFTVRVTNATGPRESTRQGGRAEFTATLSRETKKPQQPQPIIDTAAALKLQAAASAAAVNSTFENVYTTDGQPDHVLTSAQEWTQQILDGITSAGRLLPTIPETFATFINDIKNVSDRIVTLVKQPAQLAAELDQLIASIAIIPQQVDGAMALYRVLFDFELGEPFSSGVGESGEVSASNRTALTAITQSAAIIRAAQSLADLDYTSTDQAIALRDEISAQIEKLSPTLTGDGWSALRDLLVSLTADVRNRGTDLARIRVIQLVTTTPALVLAQQLYNDPDRDAELVSRNRIPHPGFVPAGVELETLSE